MFSTDGNLSVPVFICSHGLVVLEIFLDFRDEIHAFLITQHERQLRTDHACLAARYVGIPAYSKYCNKLIFP
jgi:hypothetical protein